MSAPEAMPHVLPAWMYPLLIVLAIALWLAIDRRIWNWTHCWCCRGTGRHYRDKQRRVWRGCWVCRESGRRKRWRLR